MIRRFLTRILIAVLIAACVYNWMQTQRLQEQVAALEARPALPAAQTVFVPTRASHVPEAHLSLLTMQSRWKQYEMQWQHRAGLFRSTRKKVLSYVKL